MAFILTLETNKAPRTKILWDESEVLARAAIGYDDETEDVFSVFVALSPFAGAQAGEFELVFSIERFSGEGFEQARYFDGMKTQYFLNAPQDRKLVLNAVLHSVSALVDKASPRLVTMTTYEPDLPEKALKKYWAISLWFEELGFNVGKFDPYHGNLAWVMEKP